MSKSGFKSDDNLYIVLGVCICATMMQANMVFLTPDDYFKVACLSLHSETRSYVVSAAADNGLSVMIL